MIHSESILDRILLNISIPYSFPEPSVSGLSVGAGWMRADALGHSASIAPELSRRELLGLESVSTHFPHKMPLEIWRQ